MGAHYFLGSFGLFNLAARLKCFGLKMTTSTTPACEKTFGRTLGEFKEAAVKAEGSSDLVGTLEPCEKGGQTRALDLSNSLVDWDAAAGKGTPVEDRPVGCDKQRFGLTMTTSTAPACEKTFGCTLGEFRDAAVKEEGSSDLVETLEPCEK
eukprot:3343546-Prorocentrum_lima.AAC.1